jgi:hypothetical protein
VTEEQHDDLRKRATALSAAAVERLIKAQRAQDPTAFFLAWHDAFRGPRTTDIQRAIMLANGCVAKLMTRLDPGRERFSPASRGLLYHAIAGAAIAAAAGETIDEEHRARLTAAWLTLADKA